MISGGNSTSHHEQDLALINNQMQITGHILYHEKFGNESIIWANDRIFRIVDCPQNLTPITLSPTFIIGRPVGITN